MKRAVRLDLDRCIKAGECYYNHPRHFAMDEDGSPRILVRFVESDADLKEVEEAIEVCPAQAIALDD